MSFKRDLENIFYRSSTRTRIFSFGFFATGLILGYAKGMRQAEYDKKDFSMQYLKTYENQDAVNKRIDETGKPAVIYYYLPLGQFHHILRHSFIKNSSRNHQRADFYLVNIRTHFHRAKNEIMHRFPIENMYIEIRFPKGLCQVKNTIGEEQQIQTYRRQFFNHHPETQDGVTEFLEQNGITVAKDKIEEFFTLTRKSLFQDLQN